MSRDDDQVVGTGATALRVWETDTAAPTWEDGLISGSGTVGALIFGPPGQQTVSFAHERFYLPANRKPKAPLIAPVLERVRKAVLGGDGTGAARLMTEAAKACGYDEGLIWTDPLGICASLVIRSDEEAVRALHRTVDPELGEVSVQWQSQAGGRTTLRAITPRGGTDVWLQLEAERQTTLELELGLSLNDVERVRTGAPSYADSVQGEVTPGQVGRVVVSGAHADESAVRAVTSVASQEPWVLDKSGSRLKSRVRLEAGGVALLRVTVDIDQGGESSAGEETRSEELFDWETLRADQSSTHGELVRRSSLELAGKPVVATTEELWLLARSGDLAARRRVVEVAYTSGRANAISASGELPPNLQGVWQGTWTPAWSADYTMNGNVQNGGIASLIPTGTPELAISLLRLVLPYLDDYRDNARNVFGAGGMLLPARMSNHGRANHFAAAFPHIFWVGCGGWVLRIAADIVSTTGDRSLVDDVLWELVTGVLEFAESATVEYGGRRHVVPNYSPENTPPSADSPIIADSTIDIAILRDAARCTRLLGDARGDHSLDERWERVISTLPPFRVADDGTLAEWIEPLWPENLAHRHTSQLYPLWYETDEQFSGSTNTGRQLRAAAASTIAAKIAWRAERPTAPPGRMEMAFGLVQLGVAAAALGDARSALVCAEWLAIDHWTPALTTTHDAGSIFNMDPSGGLPALVAAMLLSSEEDTVTLLPALPDEWAEQGKVTGLRARGGIVVDQLEWAGGGGSVRLRRLEEAMWLRPDRRLRIRVGSPFRMQGDAHEDQWTIVGQEPITIPFVRA